MTANTSILPTAGVRSLCLVLTFLISLSNLKAQAPEFWLSYSQESYEDGDTITISANLGSAEFPVSNITSLEYQIDPGCGDTLFRIIETNFPSSFLTDDGEYEMSESTVNCANNFVLERTGNPVSGHGRVVDHIIVIEILDGKRSMLSASPSKTATNHIYPNPATQVLHVAHNGHPETEIRIVDAKGQIIRYLEPGASQIGPIDLSGIPKGQYWVTISNSSGRETIPVVIQ